MIMWVLCFNLFIWWLIYQLIYIELSLYLWDEVYLIMMDGLFNMFLYLVCKYFIEKVFIYAYNGNWFSLLGLYVI